jgi:hypothetical protein
LKIAIAVVFMTFTAILFFSSPIIIMEQKNSSDHVWHPTLNTSWQVQFTGKINQSVDAAMYDVDLFDNNASIIDSLHMNGHKVVCYISAGTWENWRPDRAKAPDSIKGKSVIGWYGERWLDIRQISILVPIMDARMDLCKQKGFDGIEPDNMDVYQHDTGFPVTYQDQINYNKFLANEAHARGLSIGLKNDLGQINDLLPYFDWAVNEECFIYEECSALLQFIKANKAVFQIEYNLDKRHLCFQANAMNFNSIRKHRNLDAWLDPCR